MSSSHGGRGWLSFAVALREWRPFFLRGLANLQCSVMSQVFVVVAAGSVLSFIIRELGEPAIASWIIQVQQT